MTLRGRLQEAFQRHRAFILLSDFDGTLAPIVERPRDARLPSETRRILTALARHPHVRVGVVSGRTLKDLRRLVGIRRAAYAGCHGLEVAWGRARFRHPRAVAAMPLLRRVSQELAQRTSQLRGVLVEPKGLTASLHFRSANRAALPRLRAVARDVAACAPGLEVLPGKRVLEFRPRGAWGKGEAVALLRKVLAKSLRRVSPVTLYLGDDETDEAAFGALRARAFCVVVGRRRSRAAHRLRSPEAVQHLLAWLGEVLVAARGSQAVRCTRRER